MSALWERWLGEEPAVDFLRKVDADIQVGRWPSRLAAFTDYAWWALGDVLPPEASRRQMAGWLAELLLQDAEEAEEFLLSV